MSGRASQRLNQVLAIPLDTPLTDLITSASWSQVSNSQRNTVCTKCAFEEIKYRSPSPGTTFLQLPVRMDSYRPKAEDQILNLFTFVAYFHKIGCLVFQKSGGKSRKMGGRKRGCLWVSMLIKARKHKCRKLQKAEIKNSKCKPSYLIWC